MTRPISAFNTKLTGRRRNHQRIWPASFHLRPARPSAKCNNFSFPPTSITQTGGILRWPSREPDSSRLAANWCAPRGHLAGETEDVAEAVKF